MEWDERRGGREEERKGREEVKVGRGRGERRRDKKCGMG